MASAQRTANSFPPDGTPIADVVIQGLEIQDTVVVQRNMLLRPGREFLRANYVQDLKNIAELGTVDPLATQIVWDQTESGLVLTVTVKENPVIASITVIGTGKYNANEIRNELDFREGDILPTGARASTIRNLRSFYREAGFKSAQVRVLTEETDDGVIVIITVDEGERIKISKLEIEGNTQFSSFYLMNKLINTGGFLFFDNYFDERAIRDDLTILRSLYQDKGYLEAKVSLGGVDYDEEKKSVVVRYLVDEGQQFRISSGKVLGVTYFTDEELAAILGDLNDRRFQGKRLGQSLNQLRQLYGDQGYIDVAIDYRLQKDLENDTVEVIFDVEEPRESYVGQITYAAEDYDYVIDLNAFQKAVDWFAPPMEDEAVYKEVRLVSGEKYRLHQEERTIERLKRLGVFRRVRVERVPTADPQVKDVVIQTEEDPAAAYVGVVAGVGEVSGPVISFEFVQPNWTGYADRLSASATFGSRSRYYRFSYFDRYIGDSDLSARYSAYRLLDRVRAYRQRTYGAEVEVGQPYSEYVTGYYALRAERVDFSEFEPGLDTDMDGYGVLAVRGYIEEDRRDDVRFPTRGYILGGGVETGYADGFMLKFLHSYETFKKLNRDNLVYAYQHNIGLMPMDADNIGLSERFFIGGSRSLRGFRYKEVGERDSGDDKLAIGGATRLTQRHELRYPFTEGIRGRIFTDIGLLDDEMLALGKPRVGVGPGFSIDIGPVTVDVDLGFAVVRESTDRTQHLHLRLGSRF